MKFSFHWRSAVVWGLRGEGKDDGRWLRFVFIIVSRFISNGFNEIYVPWISMLDLCLFIYLFEIFVSSYLYLFNFSLNFLIENECWWIFSISLCLCPYFCLCLCLSFSLSDSLCTACVTRLQKTFISVKYALLASGAGASQRYPASRHLLVETRVDKRPCWLLLIKFRCNPYDLLYRRKPFPWILDIYSDRLVCVYLHG